MTLSMLWIACASTGSSHVEQAHSAAPAPTSNNSHVRFVSSDGILACAWGEADAVFGLAMSELGPALERCAEEQDAEEQGTTDASWVLWVDVGPSGLIERAWVPDNDQVAGSAARPPECALLALDGFQLESGPPACGSVHMLSFDVGI
jgi:hypothetical protein